jgi:hypothetical protein
MVGSSCRVGSGSLIVQGSAAALAGLAVLVWRVAVAET